LINIFLYLVEARTLFHELTTNPARNSCLPRKESIHFHPWIMGSLC